MLKNKKVAYLLLILWLIVIFLFSNQGGSESTGTSSIFVDLLSSFLNIKNIDTATFIVRKIAHFTEYLILGLLMLNVLRFYKRETKEKIIIAILLCIICASFDELHQAFIPGRSPKVQDVLIDTLGSISGILLLNKSIKLKKR